MEIVNLVKVVNRGEWRRSVDHAVSGSGHSMGVSPENSYGKVMEGGDVGCG